MQWWDKVGAEMHSTFGQTFPECHFLHDVLQRGIGWGCVWWEQRSSATSGLVQPLCSLRGLACVYVHSLLAVLALHRAAPFELALTLCDLHDSGGVVASPAAHDLTAVRAPWCLVADPPSGAQRTCAESLRVYLFVFLKKLMLTVACAVTKETTVITVKEIKTNCIVPCKNVTKFHILSQTSMNFIRSLCAWSNQSSA